MGFVLNMDKLRAGVVWLLAGLLWPTAALAQTSVYEQVNVAGSFNGWSSGLDRMQLVDDHIWQVDLTIPDETFEFKFALPGWTDNWGLNNQPLTGLPQTGTAVANGGNIQAQKEADFDQVRFLFNDQTKRFAVQVLNYVGTNTPINLIQNGSFELASASRSDRAAYWDLGNPNNSGFVQGGTTRADWQGDATNGVYFGAILGSWSGSSFGRWSQEVPVQAGLTYEASAFFRAEGAPNTWTTPSEQAMTITFFDATGTEVLGEEVLDLTGVTTTWQRQTIRAAAPAGTAWARLQIEAIGVGNSGTFRIDDVQLVAATAQRDQDFNAWTGASLDGTYLQEGWTIEGGRTASQTEFDGVTNVLARSGLAASLAAPAPGETHYVQSPRLTGGIGAVTIYYRHGHLFGQDDDEGPTQPVSLAVLTSNSGLFWQTNAVVTGILGTDYVRYDAFVNEETMRYVRIMHAGGGTERLLLDDIVIGGISDTPRLMNFDTWPDGNESVGFHTHDGWSVDEGWVSVTNALSGKAAALAGDSNSVNALVSPVFEDGVGTIRFQYRRGEDSFDPTSLAVDVSDDEGASWTTLDTVSAISSPAWTTYEQFFAFSGSYQVRIRNVFEEVTGPPSAVLLEENFDGGSGTVPAGWTFDGVSQYTSDASSGASGPPSLKFDGTGDQVVTPVVASPTNLQFMVRGNGISGSSMLLEGLQGASWVPIDTITSFASTSKGEVKSYAVNSGMTQFRWTYTKSAGNVAFDDVKIFGEVPVSSGAPQVLLLDDVEVSAPVEYRNQNFDSWPRKGTYGGDSTHQFWVITGEHIVDESNAFAGQVARLRPRSGLPAVIASHPLSADIGAIDFQYRYWPGDGGATLSVEVSADGTAWTPLDTLSGFSSSAYTRYSASVAPGYTYFRLRATASSTERVLIDDIRLSEPLPPAELLLSGSIDPAAPYITDPVTILAQTVSRNGAAVESITAYYRIGTSGGYTALAMQPQAGGVYAAASAIPAQPSGTIVQYYLEATYSGPGGQSGTTNWPATAPAEAAEYRIPRNPPGSVWINEVDYFSQDFFDETGDAGVIVTNQNFIELAGVAGVDISDWVIEIRNGMISTFPLVATYTVPVSTSFDNDTNGYGFWVLGGISLAAPDMTLTNLLGDYFPGIIQLYDEAGGLVQSLTYEGFATAGEQIPVNDIDDPLPFDPIPIEDYTNTVALTGAGGSYDVFVWSESSPQTPGAANPGQTFSDPPVIVVAPSNLVFSYIAGSSNPPPQVVTVSNAGASTLTYTIGTASAWLSVSPLDGSLAPGAVTSHTVSVDSSGRFGPLNGELVVAGQAANTPQRISVLALEQGLDVGLLQYAFDENAGSVALNGGTAGVDGNLSMAGNSWTFGASGASGDAAAEWSAGTAHGATAAALADLNGAAQLTVSGWLKASTTGAVRRLVGNALNGTGFELVLSTNGQELGFISGTSWGGATPVYTTGGAYGSGDWVYFAAVFDDAAETVAFYRGGLSDSVSLVATVDAAALGPAGTTTNRLFVGGDGVAAGLDGALDDLRVFTDALDAAVLEGLRLETAQRQQSGLFAPVITLQPVGQTVNEGGLSFFEVSASASPSPNYQWRRDGVALAGATLRTLTLSETLREDAGEYTVVVINSQGAVTSAVASLVVNYAPVIMEQPTNVTVEVGQPASLRVMAEAAPDMTYEWRVNGIPIAGATSDVYTIPSASLLDEGAYRVYIQNAIGTEVSEVAMLDVLAVDQPGFGGGAIGPTADGSGFVLRWDSVTGYVYRLSVSTNLMDTNAWTVLESGVPATAPLNVYTDEQWETRSPAFYRLEVE